jgi:hypothetical protein
LQRKNLPKRRDRGRTIAALNLNISMWSAAVYEAVQGRPAERAQVFQFHPEKVGSLAPPLVSALGGPAASFSPTDRFGRLASQNDWESAQTEILVAKEPYAEAQGRHGCILMKEVSDDRRVPSDTLPRPVHVFGAPQGKEKRWAEMGNPRQGEGEGQGGEREKDGENKREREREREREKEREMGRSR